MTSGLAEVTAQNGTAKATARFQRRKQVRSSWGNTGGVRERIAGDSTMNKVRTGVSIISYVRTTAR